MVTLNLTVKEAEYLFYIMMSQEVGGDEEATQIMDKLPLPKKRGQG